MFPSSGKETASPFVCSNIYLVQGSLLTPSIFAEFTYFIAYSIILARYATLRSLSSYIKPLNYSKYLHIYTKRLDSLKRNGDSQILSLRSCRSSFFKQNFFWISGYLLKRNAKGLSVVLFCKVFAHWALQPSASSISLSLFRDVLKGFTHAVLGKLLLGFFEFAELRS